MLINDIITAIVLGLIGGLIPGPIVGAIFTDIIQTGFRSSLRIVFLAFLAEFIVALFSIVVFSSLELPPVVFVGISLLGSLVLIWIATIIWKVSRLTDKKKVHFSFGKIFLMVLSNGLLWTFWVTVCVPKAIFLDQKVWMGQYLFLLLVELGWLASTIFLAYGFSHFKSFLSKPKAISIIFKVFSLIFIYFALEMVYKSIVFFVSYSSS